MELDKRFPMTTLTASERANSTTMSLSDAAFKARAREHLAEWARRAPFYVFNDGPTQVIVGRYADVQEVFTDPVRFASRIPKGPGYEQFDKFMGGEAITQLDGEKHARLRRLLMPAFAPKRLDQLETRITERIDKLLDDIEAMGPHFDGMTHYASRLVVAGLLTAMLNLTDEDADLLLAFQETMPLITATKPGQPYPDAAMHAAENMFGVIRRVIADRRAHPRSDFLGDLVAARDAGDKLDDRELFDQIFAIFAALATTPRSASGALYMLYTHRDQLQQLIDNPALISDALEECLRIAGNGYFTFPRLATCDTQVGGTRILKGMIVRPSPLASCYDASVFPEPLKFDIHRKPKRIMTFGAGPHHCIGSGLGRRTLNIALQRFLARFPKARLRDADFTPEYGGATGELRMKSLPMMAW